MESSNSNPDGTEPRGAEESAENAASPARRLVDVLVTPDGNVWEMRCGHCGKIERYVSEKEALDAAQDHVRSLGINEEPRLRLDAANGARRDPSEP